jgi:hypothetical protein
MASEEETIHRDGASGAALDLSHNNLYAIVRSQDRKALGRIAEATTHEAVLTELREIFNRASLDDCQQHLDDEYRDQGAPGGFEPLVFAEFVRNELGMASRVRVGDNVRDANWRSRIKFPVKAERDEPGEAPDTSNYIG